MKFTTNREALLRPLQLVTGVVERRQTLPVLANLLVRARDGVLSMTGTDLEVELVAESSDLEIERDGDGNPILGGERDSREVFHRLADNESSRGEGGSTPPRVNSRAPAPRRSRRTSAPTTRRPTASTITRACCWARRATAPR